ncbi:hypothetical protein MTR_2g023560 [Medicago truncatula]|uniref:Uncharacterized protein n=1 Tax=Medicago truncatula TaxID=3880 RepID=A0A072V512_MEDTR|nr:hypothetical protein MTR_2g023560 [Medicago truncatula]
MGRIRHCNMIAYFVGFLKEFDNSPCIPNQQNASFFENSLKQHKFAFKVAWKLLTLMKKLTVRFQPKEDKLLIQSWLNISKDPIDEIDQRGDSFWMRIGEAYNNQRDKNFQERKPMTLKVL